MLNVVTGKNAITCAALSQPILQPGFFSTLQKRGQTLFCRVMKAAFLTQKLMLKLSCVLSPKPLTSPSVNKPGISGPLLKSPHNRRLMSVTAQGFRIKQISSKINYCKGWGEVCQTTYKLQQAALALKKR